MKQFFFLSIFLFSIIISFADGWRPAEKQVIVTITTEDEASSLAMLKISYDVIAPNKIRAYVIPKELDQIEMIGLAYEIEIEDLNKYNPNFWLAEDSYHTYDQIIALADSLEENFPLICKRYIFGMDETGQYELTALKISDNVETDEPEAEVMFDGGIHGDEVGGAENVIRFARDLCLDYGNDPDLTFLIDNREIWLYLMVNPYGRVQDIRYNSNGVDLNRDWCYMWDAWGGSPGPCSQDESKALRECMYNNQFVVHTSYHSGTEYISCPWSYRSSTPHDMSHILQLAGTYASTSGYSIMEYGQGNSGMYPINGSTKDSNYGIMGSISWSMEISYSKHPPASQIMTYYNYNKPAMIAMIEYAGFGLEGSITDAISGDPVTAIVFVNDYHPTYSDPTAGDYHKYVLAGTYSITVMANGYETQTIDDIVVTEFNATTTDFQLQPEAGQYAYKFSASQIPDNNEADEGWTAGALGAPDMVNYSIGKNGWVVLDMQYPVIDGPGIDLIIHEGDTSPEGFTCYAGETIDGPWMSMGTGTGTSEFDLSMSGLAEAQFVKLADDGDGTANASNAGFDLDAIEALEPVSGIYIAMYEYTIDDSDGNNNGRIDPGETVDIIVNLKNNGDILAEDITGLLSTSSLYIEVDNGTANFGSLSQGQSADGIFTITANSGTPQGSPVEFDLEIESNGGTYNNTFSMSFSVGLIVEDWETGNFEQFEWETGGNADWAISTEDPYEGIYCVKSGTINHNQSSFLSITFDVLASGEVSFFTKVSSEDSYDYLKFYIDGGMMDQWAGEVSWTETSYLVTPGEHTFKWEYDKDGSVSSGSDCAWVDFICLPSGAANSILTGFTSDVTQVCEGETVNFSDASTGDIISWEWIFEGGSPATSTAQNPEVVYLNTGNFDVTLTVSDGTNTSSLTFEDYISVHSSPEIPETPVGQEFVGSNPGSVSDYLVNEVLNADLYVWQLDPPAAGSITENGNECSIDWTDYWEGEVNLSVKAVNDCGESDFSENLLIYVTTVDINENLTGKISLFPNPNKGEFILSFDSNQQENIDIKILDNLGKIVFESNEQYIINNSLNINLDKIDVGIYFILVKTNNNILKEKIIIK